MSASVEHVPEQHRYEIHVDGERAGLVAYEEQGDRIALTHTEVDDRFEGQGLGSQLIQGALDDLRGRDLQVLPSCGFVRSYIAEHEEYLDLVPSDVRGRFELPEAA